MSIPPRGKSEGPGWTRRWHTWMRALGLDGDRGSTRVRRLEVLAGVIIAGTAGRNGVICDVEVRFRQWSEDEWQRAIDALGSQALYAAQLLAGDVPPDLERLLTGAGLQLLPATRAEVTEACTCGTAARRPCEHLIAVYYSLGEMLADEPWLLFRLRGRDQQHVLRELRTQRSRGELTPPSGSPSRPGAAASPAGAGFYRTPTGTSDDDSVPDLEQQLDAYWGNIKLINGFRPHIVPAPVELALLRRLGPPAMGAAGGDTYDRLTALYRDISRTALRLAFADDSSD
jgi:uncharacterized Zn finger protein